MGKFHTKLVVEPAEDTEHGRSLWTLAAPLVYKSDSQLDAITVPEGFITDFASVPRIPLVYLIMNDVGQEAAVIHDYLYRFKSLPRNEADAILCEALTDLGVSKWRRTAMWLAVRAFGWSAY